MGSAVRLQGAWEVRLCAAVGLMVFCTGSSESLLVLYGWDGHFDHYLVGFTSHPYMPSWAIPCSGSESDTRDSGAPNCQSNLHAAG